MRYALGLTAPMVHTWPVYVRVYQHTAVVYMDGRPHIHESTPIAAWESAAAQTLWGVFRRSDTSFRKTVSVSCGMYTQESGLSCTAVSESRPPARGASISRDAVTFKRFIRIFYYFRLCTYVLRRHGTTLHVAASCVTVRKELYCT